MRIGVGVMVKQKITHRNCSFFTVANCKSANNDEKNL